MQVVINIDDAIYKRAMVYKGEQFPDNDDLLGALITAVANGTPLPKGHGALKDTDAICRNIISALGIRDENYLLEAEKDVYKRIKNAQTIIGADE